MAGIRELVLTFLESLAHNALCDNRKRETLDACITISNFVVLCLQMAKIWPSKVTRKQTPSSLQLRLAPLSFQKEVKYPILSNPYQQPSHHVLCFKLITSYLHSEVKRFLGV